MLVARKLLPLGFFAALVPGVHAFDCVEKYCTKMSSCAEASHHFTVCGESERDADNDGIPCENVCGNTLEEYNQRRGAGSPSLLPPDDQPMPRGAGSAQPERPPIEHGMSPPAPAASCGAKRKCGQMLSCEEARFYLSSCGVRALDRDGDGVPCESLCGGR